MATILVIEDSLEMAHVVRTELEQAGFRVEHETDGLRGLTAALGGAFTAVVIDINLPTKNGFDICRELRSKKSGLPILMLTSRGDELDKVIGLELGADDYLTKPFSPREFIARVRALLRRAETNALPMQLLTFGPLRIDGERRRVTLNDQPLELTAIEFDLLYFLAKNAGTPFTRDELMEQVWGYRSSGFDPTVTTQLSRLRARLEPNPSKPTFIRTVRGVGYRFVEPHEV